MPQILSMPISTEQQGLQISSASFLNQVNRPSESDFTAFQNLVSEHSIARVPASLYNLTKSAQDPFCPSESGP